MPNDLKEKVLVMRFCEIWCDFGYDSFDVVLLILLSRYDSGYDSGYDSRYNSWKGYLMRRFIVDRNQSI